MFLEQFYSEASQVVYLVSLDTLVGWTAGKTVSFLLIFKLFCPLYIWTIKILQKTVLEILTSIVVQIILIDRILFFFPRKKCSFKLLLFYSIITKYFFFSFRFQIKVFGYNAKADQAKPIIPAENSSVDIISQSVWEHLMKNNTAFLHVFMFSESHTSDLKNKYQR